MIPPRSILAAVDFSDLSGIALGYAARLARHTGAELHVLHAEDPLLHAAGRATGRDLTAETREELERFMRSIHPANGLPTAYHVVVGRSVEVVCDLANREQVDLVVLGSRGMTGPAHAIFGSTTEEVLLRSDVSVLVVPGSWEPPRPETSDLSGTGPITVGFELTTPATAAAGAAGRLARVLGTTVDAVHVVPTIRVLERWRIHAETAAKERIEAARRELSAALQTIQSEVPVRLIVESGDVAERLAAAYTSTDAAGRLVVLGRRSPGSRSGPPGAIAARVMARSASPVMVYVADS
jgi:nucleotide-binding universal stress UspA family protein